MPTLTSVDRSHLYQAFMEAFADYQMDASRTTEEGLLLRAAKNAVDFDASVGLYDEGKLVGFTLIGIDAIDGAQTAFDAGTGIVPTFRKQGWARAMFDHALPELRARGVSRFLLEVLQENEPAVKAYRKSGFEIVRELRCYVAETAKLRELSDRGVVEIRPVEPATIIGLSDARDWTPSFENRLSALLSTPTETVCLAAFDEEQCVGGVAYIPALNWLLSLTVSPAHRRRGVAGALLHHLSVRIPDSVTRLSALNVDGSDTGMQAFLGAVGFEPLVDQYEMARAIDA